MQFVFLLHVLTITLARMDSNWDHPQGQNWIYCTEEHKTRYVHSGIETIFPYPARDDGLKNLTLSTLYLSTEYLSTLMSMPCAVRKQILNSGLSEPYVNVFNMYDD